MTQNPQVHYANADTGPKQHSGLGVAALICGIIAILLSLIPGFNICLATPVALVALGLGIAGLVVSLNRQDQKSTMAIVGLVLAVVAFASMWLVNMLAGAALTSWGQGFTDRALIVEEATTSAEELAADARSRGADPTEVQRAMSRFNNELARLGTSVAMGDADEMRERADAALADLEEELDDLPTMEAEEMGPGDATDNPVMPGSGGGTQ
jgi:hypothetical protein